MRKPIWAFLPLLLVLVACAKGPAAQPPTDSGIRGIVAIGPTCPVERLNSPCPDRPTAAEIKVTVDGKVVKTFSTRPDGRFSVSLAPGDYMLEPVAPNPGTFPIVRPIAVTVQPHQFKFVKLVFDSGIR